MFDGNLGSLLYGDVSVMQYHFLSQRCRTDFELSYTVSHIRTNTATGFEQLYSKENIHCYE